MSYPDGWDDDSCEHCGGIDYHRAECPYLSRDDDYEDEDSGWVTHRDDSSDLWDTDPIPPASPTQSAVNPLSPPTGTEPNESND